MLNDTSIRRTDKFAGPNGVLYRGGSNVYGDIVTCLTHSVLNYSYSYYMSLLYIFNGTSVKVPPRKGQPLYKGHFHSIIIYNWSNVFIVQCLLNSYVITMTSVSYFTLMIYMYYDSLKYLGGGAMGGPPPPPPPHPPHLPPPPPFRSVLNMGGGGQCPPPPP